MIDDHVDYYTGLGFSVIPAYPRTKIPAVEWKIYQRKKPPDEVIRSWRQLWGSGYNIGVVCGAVFRQPMRVRLRQR